MSKTIEDTIKEINKKYGARTVQTVDKKENMKVETYSTNCYSLDKIFVAGGFPKGRILDVYGEPSHGKTTLALYLAAQVQKQGGTVVWIDAEYAMTSEYAEKLGVDTKKLILVQPNSAEEALGILEDFVTCGEIALVVIDSTGALVPQKELDGEMGDHNIALQARLMSKALRIIVASASKNKTSVVFISQLRQKIGMFVGATTDATGGKALKFWASVRLEVKKIKTLKGKKDEVIGNKLKITATKNKVGKPFLSATIDLFFEKGIDVIGDIVNVAVESGIIKREGTTYSLDGKKLAVGIDATKAVIESDPELLKKIKDKLT